MEKDFDRFVENSGQDIAPVYNPLCKDHSIVEITDAIKPRG